MTINSFQQVFRALNSPAGTSFERHHLPMINSLTTSLDQHWLSVTQIRKKKALMSWYKAIPELTGLVNKVARDIVNKFHFEPISPTDSGRNKVMKANRFAQEIGLKKIMFSQVVDMLVTGEGFGWIGKLADKQVKEKIGSLVSNHCWAMEKKEKALVADKFFLELKQEEGFADREHIDEDLLRPRKYRSIASTTMEIVHDQFDIKRYDHVVGMNKIKFTLKEIIHFTFMDIDGKVNGFTSVEAIIVQLELLRQMWQNQLSLHKNGGHPDKLFILENARVNDPAYERIKQQLEKYKLVENRHGTMVFTGKVTVEDLQQLDSMQFKDQGLYITGVMAMQWQVPKSSIPYIIGGTNTKDDSGGNSEKGYWRNIEFGQSIFAETKNTQLWIPHFGVKIVFDHTFPQGDVQVQTARNLLLNNILSEDKILGTSDKQLNLKRKLRLLGRSDLDLEDKKEEEFVGAAVGMGTQQQPSPNKVNMGSEQQNVSANKRTEQQNVIGRRGKPTGVGKEIKEVKEAAKLNVDLNTFTKVYNEDKAFHFNPPRLFRKRNEDFISYLFKSSDFVYQTVINSEDNELNRVKISNLGSKIYDI